MANKVILGISAFYYDSAAAIIKNGKIVAAAQEERVFFFYLLRFGGFEWTWPDGYFKPNRK